MPDSEEFYRDQKRLNLVFLVSAIALFLSTIWMMAADHYLPWKHYAREFEVLKREKLSNELARQEQDIDQAKLADLTRKKEEAQEKLDAQQSELSKATEARDNLKNVQVEIATRKMQFLKADLSEQQSQYDLSVGLLSKLSGDDAGTKKRLERKRDAG